MRSFGLWYKQNTEKQNEPIFSVHINFWSESVKKGKDVPDLDIGIKITHFRNVEKLVFHCPFVIENDVRDLIPKLCKKENANLIFNTDGEIETKDSYSIYSFEKNDKRESLLLFPLNQDVGKIYLLSEDDNKTDIVLDFSTFNTYLKQKEKFTDIDEVYIRFRITSIELQNSIYFDFEPANKSFESAFSGTRIYDFKINEKRNLGSKTITKMEMDHYKFPQIDNIHLLVMEPSSYDVESFANPQMTCRELEGALWDDYFESDINYSKGRILAYHWKFDNKCSCLVKVKYSKTNASTLWAYVLIVLALGIVSSTIVSMIQAICTHEDITFSVIALGVGVFFVGLGLHLGAKK